MQIKQAYNNTTNTTNNKHLDSGLLLLTILLLLAFGWLGGTTGSASDQRSEGCGFEAY